MPATPEQFEKIKQIVNRVLSSTRSDFYRAMYARENFSAGGLNKPADIERIPRLMRGELASSSPFERLYGAPEDITAIRYTSGTSNAPLMLVFRSAVRYGIPGKKPLILFYTSQIEAYNAQLKRTASSPYFPPLIGHQASYVVTAKTAEAYDIDAIVGVPSRILGLAPEMTVLSREGVEDVFIVGERISASILDELRAQFPKAEIDNRYGMSELGCPGYQCPELRKSSALHYHCAPEYLLEITDPQDGGWRETGVEGEIVLTELDSTPHQLVRYRTGDAGRIVSEEACACGAPFTFEVTGRIDHDIIKIAGGVLRTDEIERVVKEFNRWVKPDFRAVIEIGIQNRPILKLYLILRDDIGHSTETMRQDIAKRIFLTTTKTLANFLEENLFGGFELIFMESFPPETKAQKLRFN